MLNSIVLGVALLLQVTMDQNAALNKVQQLWGPLGHISVDRGLTDTYETKHLQYASVGCYTDYTDVAKGLNTWDAAVANLPANNGIATGTYSGVITLKARAHDDIAIASVQFRLDGSQIADIVITVPVMVVDTSFTWNSGTVPNGVHAACATTTDASGNTGQGKPFLFRTDQSQTSVSTEIKVP